MHQCPSCRSGHIHRSRPKTKWETWRRQITGKRPYRCHECNWRGWGPDAGPTFSAPEQEIPDWVPAPDAPCLNGRTLLRAAQSAEAIDLDQLDYPRFPRLSDASLARKDE